MHAEIGADDALVLAHDVGRPVGDLAAVVEHHHAVGDVHHYPHIVLDQGDRGAEFVIHVQNEAAHVLLLFGVHPGHRLVEQQQRRLGGERPAQLDPFLQAVGQASHRDLANRLDLEELDNSLDIFAVLDLLPLARSPI